MQTHILKFTDISYGENFNSSCPAQDPPTCVAIQTSKLSWKIHGKHKYYGIVRVNTIAGHHADYVSDEYIHIYGPPAPGRAWEAKREDEVSWNIVIISGLLMTSMNFCSD